MRSPAAPRYAYRERRYPWAEANLRRAEAQHGAPKPTCYCGAPLGVPNGGRVPRCAACGRSPAGNYGDYAERAGPAPQPFVRIPRCDGCGFVLSATSAALLAVQQCTCGPAQRCPDCGYLTGTVGHRAECGTEAVSG